jgi:high-affinity nickel-transport protein
MIFNTWPDLRRELFVAGVIISVTLLLWATVFVLVYGTVSSAQPAFLGTCVLAYTFGLRHAFDADHITAIDSVTRQLLSLDRYKNSEEGENRRPILVGLFFAIGHSMVVVIACLLLIVLSTQFTDRLDIFGSVGGLIAGIFITCVFFLLTVLSLASAISLFKLLRKRNAKTHETETLDENDEAYAIPKFLRPLLRVIDRQWKMIPVGFLFGLGFDTSSEIALLALSSGKLTSINNEQSNEVSNPWMLILLPLLFACGMSLLDYSNGALMCRLYAWSLEDSDKNELVSQSNLNRISFNFVITCSALVLNFFMFVFALLNLLVSELELSGEGWEILDALGQWFWVIGLGSLFIFTSAWFVFSRLTIRTSQPDEEQEMP